MRFIVIQAHLKFRVCQIISYCSEIFWRSVCMELSSTRLQFYFCWYSISFLEYFGIFCFFCPPFLPSFWGTWYPKNKKYSRRSFVWPWLIFFKRVVFFWRITRPDFSLSLQAGRRIAKLGHPLLDNCLGRLSCFVIELFLKTESGYRKNERLKEMFFGNSSSCRWKYRFTGQKLIHENLSGYRCVWAIGLQVCTISFDIHVRLDKEPSIFHMLGFSVKHFPGINFPASCLNMTSAAHESVHSEHSKFFFVIWQ